MWLDDNAVWKYNRVDLFSAVGLRKTNKPKSNRFVLKVAAFDTEKVTVKMDGPVGSAIRSAY